MQLRHEHKRDRELRGVRVGDGAIRALLRLNALLQLCLFVWRAGRVGGAGRVHRFWVASI